MNRDRLLNGNSKVISDGAYNIIDSLDRIEGSKETKVQAVALVAVLLDEGIVMDRGDLFKIGHHIIDDLKMNTPLSLKAIRDYLKAEVL